MACTIERLALQKWNIWQAQNSFIRQGLFEALETYCTVKKHFCGLASTYVHELRNHQLETAYQLTLRTIKRKRSHKTLIYKTQRRYGGSVNRK